MKFPSFNKLSADQITAFQPIIDSTCYIWKALAWIDHAKRTTTLSSVEYAALNLRLGIEMLWWENLFISLGGEMTQQEVKKYKSDSTTLYKVIKRLAPDYRKLVAFTKIIGAVDRSMPEITAWDLDGELCRLHGGASHYLHVHGPSIATVGNPEWMVEAYEFIESGAESIRKQLGNTGVISLSGMPPEVRDVWESFKAGTINAESARTRLDLAHPVLRERRIRAAK